MRITLSYILTVITFTVNASHNILNFGAIPFKTDLGAENANAAAFHKAVMSAHKHHSDKEVLIPANYTFNMVLVQTFDHIENVVITVDGTVLLSQKFGAMIQYEKNVLWNF